MRLAIAIVLFATTVTNVYAGGYCGIVAFGSDQSCDVMHWDSYIADQGGVLILESTETLVAQDAPFLGYVTVYFGLYGVPAGPWRGGPVATAVLQSEVRQFESNPLVDMQCGEMRLYSCSPKLTFTF